MSKSNDRYGKTLYTLHSSIEANPVPSQRLQREWERLDKYSRIEYRKQYDSLTDEQKVQIHFNANTGVYKEQ